jgi:hypothetical protein
MPRLRSVAGEVAVNFDFGCGHTRRAPVPPPFLIWPAGRRAPPLAAAPRRCSHGTPCIVWNAVRCALTLQQFQLAWTARLAARAVPVAACRALRGRDTHSPPCVTAWPSRRHRSPPKRVQWRPAAALGASESLRGWKMGSARPGGAGMPAPNGSASFMAWEDRPVGARAAATRLSPK